jgi:hypothetical protein
MDCQLGDLPEAGQELNSADRASRTLQKTFGFFVRGAGKVLRDPTILARKVRELSSQRARADAPAPPRPAPLGLTEGERVRVRSWEEIEATLDGDERTGGLGWMALQRAFCGGTYKVARRVERFFDERTRKMLKVKGVVLLEGVHCMPPKDGPDDYAGCQRMCLLFWKEDWLERVADGESSAAS